MDRLLGVVSLVLTSSALVDAPINFTATPTTVGDSGVRFGIGRLLVLSTSVPHHEYE